MKKIVFCLDGLGGLPDVTFLALLKALEAQGYEVVLVDVDGICTHEDRVQRLIVAYEIRLAVLKASGETAQFYFIGQSAGGSAASIAAERVVKKHGSDSMLAGLIPLSRALSFGIPYMTRQLLASMTPRTPQMCYGRFVDKMHMIKTSAQEYQPLVEPMPARHIPEVVANRQPIAGHEAFTLAFWAPKLSEVVCPVLIVYGSRDQWISANGHRTLCKKIVARRGRFPVQVEEIDGAGHLTMASDMRDEVIAMIVEWIKNN